VPKDVQNSFGLYSGKVEINRQSYQIKQRKFSLNHDNISQAIDLIASAKRPIFYVGGGVINSGDEACEVLTKLVRHLGFPITNTLMGLGAFPATDKHFIGMLGMHGTYEANLAMYGCDVMINIGARFDDRVTGKVSGFSPDSKKIHIDIDECSIDKIIKVDVAINADANHAIKALLEEIERRKIGNRRQEIKDWWHQIEKWQSIKSLSYEASKKTIKPEYAIERLNALTKDAQPFVSTDVGQHQMWTAQYIQFDKPKKWLTSGGLGTMGYGVPSAIGAQIANPQDLVICVSGDASFMMNMQELSTIKQYNLPVKIFILNNRYMGMVRQWQELIHGGRYSHSYTEALPDFVAVARGFGWQARTVNRREDLEAAIAECLASPGPFFLDVHVSAEANCFPMIPAGAGHHEVNLGR
jgi:acetolactate synthase-1/2/3 large subunit